MTSLSVIQCSMKNRSDLWGYRDDKEWDKCFSWLTEWNSGVVMGMGWSNGRISINVKSHFAKGTKLVMHFKENCVIDMMTYSVTSRAIWLCDSWKSRASLSMISIRFLNMQVDITKSSSIAQISYILKVENRTICPLFV